MATTIDDDAGYVAENGAFLHGRCLGATARATGRTLDGEPLLALTRAGFAELAKYGIHEVVCEGCARPINNENTRADARARMGV